MFNFPEWLIYSNTRYTNTWLWNYTSLCWGTESWGGNVQLSRVGDISCPWIHYTDIIWKCSFYYRYQSYHHFLWLPSESRSVNSTLAALTLRFQLSPCSLHLGAPCWGVPTPIIIFFINVLIYYLEIFLSMDTTMCSYQKHSINFLVFSFLGLVNMRV